MRVEDGGLTRQVQTAQARRLIRYLLAYEERLFGPGAPPPVWSAEVNASPEGFSVDVLRRGPRERGPMAPGA
jgi:hypothetical protein